MEKLIRGVARFRQTVYPPLREQYRRVLDRQQPHTLFVACSDSRVDTGVLTQSGPGDIFVLRNAGNLVPPYGAGHGGEAATVEYAVAGLGVRHVVVCGHTRCGAVRALLEPNGLADLPETRRWLRHAESTRRIAEGKYNCLNFAERWAATVEENVLVQLDHLRTHPAVAAALARGELTLYGWVFDLEHGHVRHFDPAQGRFVPLPDDDGNDPLPPSPYPQLVASPTGGARGDASTLHPDLRRS
jgi:carbonic anhydrase